MAEETIVAVYDTAAHAQAAVSALRAAAVPDNAISVQEGGATTATTATAPREQGFWSSLFGGEPGNDTAVYDRSVQGGSSVVTVRVPDQHADQVMQILEAQNPIDIDERANSYGLTQTTTTQTPIAPSVQPTTASTSNQGGTIQLAEEQLAVGKRLVNKGGTRIRRFVVETPVEQQVTLHDEKVTMDRRPVTDGRPTTDSFSDKTIEMTESSEEAVVAKTARVYEEVGLHKEATDRVETVRDTVRKEEVEIEQIPGSATTTTTRMDTVAPRTPKV